MRKNQAVTYETIETVGSEEVGGGVIIWRKMVVDGRTDLGYREWVSSLRGDWVEGDDAGNDSEKERA
jgi:hypothetical protein